MLSRDDIESVAIEAPAADRDPDASRPPAGDIFGAAVRLHQTGNVAEAETLYRQIIGLVPAHAEAWSNLAMALLARQAFAEAAVAARRALAVRPHYPEACLNLIGALQGLGDTAALIPAYETAIALQPGRMDLRSALALHLEGAGKIAEAAAIHFGTAQRTPTDALAHFHLARLLTNLGKAEEAVAAYQNAIIVKPDFAEAHSNLGTALSGLGRFAEAVAAGRRAIALAPRSAEIAMNCGVVLQQSGHVADAVRAYESALAINPRNAGAHANLGVAYQELFRFDDAVQAFERAIAIKPDFHTAAVELIKLRRHICDWSRYERDRQQLLGFLETKSDVIFMLLMMGFESDPQQQLDCARLHMRRLNADRRRLCLPPRPPSDGRMRIGYLSTDYRDHPVGRLLPDLFGRHDRNDFEIFGYALGTDDAGALRRRIAASCDRFVDLHPLSNNEAAQRIATDGIDILVDLTGPTVGSRLDILVRRPAPVQVSFLGWPGTMGADCIDYVVGDPFLMPAGSQRFYAETIVRLPHCYQPSDPHRRLSDVVLSRADCGLPDGAFVFCSFNNTTKLTPQMFDLWMRLLRRVGGSVLWLYCKTPRTMANLRDRAKACGVDPERIVFASVAQFDVYLGRLRLADLFLDSFPYNAGATCNDALFMGLPVLTLSGETYVSRMAGSLLTAAGLPELITSSPEDYEALAFRLATEPGLFEGLRQRLAAARDTCALFDMARFTRSLEAAFRHMHEQRSGIAAPPAA
ncbi:MAG TPA: tetratricopeptide repeat protein [Lichenihabitans sp.]|jgi:predicted O-linked N-acetylglucosamine transferase (SPINDLY family)|nr:tetratricopeptide repeat protein [Lichenihabitans sp.]